MRPPDVRFVDGMTRQQAWPTPASELLELLSERPTWHADAACKEHPEVDFFLEHDDANVAAARAVCDACLVKDECGQYAATFPPRDQFGIWAGLRIIDRVYGRRPDAAA